MTVVKKLFLVLVLVAAIPGIAATRTVTLAVPTMTCPVCPITVKKALQSVQGVSNVEVSYAKKEAVVTYDDSKATVVGLTKATANAGYPSTPKSQVK